VSGKEHAEVIVNFGGGGEGGAGGTSGLALLDRESGGKTLDRIDGTGGQLRQVMAGVSGETFEVAALSFRVDGVEGERAFS